MQEKRITLKNVGIRAGQQTIIRDLNLEMLPGEEWVITGHSGSGKSLLAKALTGMVFYSGTIENTVGTIILVEQQHHFKNRSNVSQFYYQQRFNSADASDSLTVSEYLDDPGNETIGSWMDKLGVRELLLKPLIQLSNGENKRVQLVAALMSRPDLLILDSPFTGLDTDGRKMLHGIINDLAGSGLRIILIVPPLEIPESATHILALEKGTVAYAGPKSGYSGTMIKDQHPYVVALDPELLASCLPPVTRTLDTVIEMRGVTVKYGDQTILDNINWTVRAGEQWNIAGPNGVGKSTLLSLVNGDNPQAYANEIYLFGRKRGSGESIWDIKRNIGFVSPELHLFFDDGSSCFDVVASGLFDTIGLFRMLSDEQTSRVVEMLRLFRLMDVRGKLLFNLSLGEQRMVLLARALIKNPPLLILDEPCQGLDDQQAFMIRELIDQVCRANKTTLLYVSHYKKDIPGGVRFVLALEKEGYRIEN